MGGRRGWPHQKPHCEGAKKKLATKGGKKAEGMLKNRIQKEKR
jgi:CDGSH-type Zn-finger protein